MRGHDMFATSLGIYIPQPEEIRRERALTHMTQIQGSYTLSERDYLAGWDEHAGAFSVKAIRAFGAFCLALAVATTILRPNEYVLDTALAIVGLWLIFGRNLILRRWYKRDFRYKHETYVSLSDEGVSFMSQGSSASSNWNRLLAHMESNNVFLLYPTERIFYIVPKIAFRPAELAEVQQCLRRNVPLRHMPWFRQPWGASVLVLLYMLVLSVLFASFVFNEQPHPSNGVFVTSRA